MLGICYWKSYPHCTSEGRRPCRPPAKQSSRSVCEGEPNSGFITLLEYAKKPPTITSGGFLFYVPEGMRPLQADCAAILPKHRLRRPPTRGSHPHGRKNTTPKGGAFFTSQKGFEPLTDGLEGRCSIQLSYWDIGIFQAKNILSHTLEKFNHYFKMHSFLVLQDYESSISGYIDKIYAGLYKDSRPPVAGCGKVRGMSALF